MYILCGNFLEKKFSKQGYDLRRYAELEFPPV
jgi:hypothetical protein